MKLIPSYLKILIAGLFLAPGLLQAQGKAGEESMSLDECVAYALENRAAMEQARIDEAIGEREVRASLSGWLPQVSARLNGIHNLKLRQQPFGDQIITLGQEYTSDLTLEASQTLFSSDLLLSSRAARHNRRQLEQQVESAQINTVVSVSKAFYDLLLTQEQLRILDQNLARQQKLYQDAKSRYEVGLVDKTDYQRAAITLGNIRSQRKRAEEGIEAKRAYLKQLMGYPLEQELKLSYSYDRMEQAVWIDTTQALQYENRVEIQQLKTRQELLSLNTAYHKWTFLPSISAFGNYNLLHFNNELSALYQQSYPTSAIGLQLSLPLFQGGRRMQQLRIAQLREDRLRIAMEDTRRSLNTEYRLALANYKSDYTEWANLQDNLEMAQEVYDIIKLQYDEGIKAYVELVVAETELRNTQLNYYNALYRLLASKLEYQRALGSIELNP